MPLTVLMSVKFSREAALGEKKLQRARIRKVYSYIRAQGKLTIKHADKAMTLDT